MENPPPKVELYLELLYLCLIIFLHTYVLCLFLCASSYLLQEKRTGKCGLGYVHRANVFVNGDC